MKLKEFLEDFKNDEILNIKDLGLSEEDEFEYIETLKCYFGGKVEDRDIVLDDLDCEKGFLYNLFCEFFEDEFIKDNELGCIWYEYSLEDLFRDSFGIGGACENNLFEIDDINNKLYGEGWDD